MLTPSAEQAEIVEAAQRGMSLRVLAFAGTGKTTTLEMLARSLPRDRRILYVVFNKAQQVMAQQRFSDLEELETRTAHSLAYGPVGSKVKGRLESRQWVAESQWLAFLKERKALDGFADQRAAGRCIVQTLGRFLATADPRIDVVHVPDASDVDRENVASLARRLWLSLETNEHLFVTHDWYLKQWQLREPTLPWDVILYDEAQDATPVMLAVVQRQARAQQVFVGDRHQQLYEFRGAINALDSIGLPAFPLTETRRFGPQIARAANAILDAKGERLRITGLASPPDRVVLGSPTRPNVVLARTNVGLVYRAVELIDRGLRLFIRGATGADGLAGNGAGELRALIAAAFDLRSGRPAKHPLFESFAGWEELQRTAEEDGGEAYRPYVRLVAYYDKAIPKVLAKIRDHTVAREEEADVVMSTVHRFKGEERDVVVLADDFQAFVSRRSNDRQGQRTTLDVNEANVAYVACTRARNELWYGAAEKPFRDSFAFCGGELPVTQSVPPSPVPLRRLQNAATGVVGRGRGAAAPTPPQARTYRDLTPGSRWLHPRHGELTILDATAQLILVTTHDGETKSLATLGAYPRLKQRFD